MLGSATALGNRLFGEHKQADADLSVHGVAKVQAAQAKSRIAIAMMAFCVVYLIFGARMAQLAMMTPESLAQGVRPSIGTLASRPDLVDRNGIVLATDIKTFSLFAEPNRIVDADEAVEKLAQVLPEIDTEAYYKRLTKKTKFEWLARELTPREQRRILDLGIPGIGFRPESRRFYPGGPLAAHIVGHTNIDNEGIAGMEKYLDDNGLRDLQAVGLAVGREMEPVALSIDSRAQFALRDELVKAMAKYNAIAAGAVIINARTGEIAAMASLPDYDPNNPVDALKKENLNRLSAGVFEMGSTFKAFTTAMALDSGLVNMGSRFDARKPLRIGKFTINDFHAKKRVLSVPEVFIYSSNIGTAKMAQTVGVEGHREFIKRIGLLDRMEFELPEVARPTEPAEWKKLNSITISYGHGMATTPLQTAVAAAAMMNGGKYIAPTLQPRTEAEANAIARPVIQPQTSRQMRELMRMNVEKGSGRRAEVNGYFVGGKTGTAEKVKKGRYSSDHRFNAFLAAFPIDDPEYVVLVFIDEPKPEKGLKSATAGLNAAPTVGAIIRRAAPLLGVQPRFGADGEPALVKF
jgi:cell division protein FtsI (penicillin-binding protein 3)